ncbi:hypothetical protein P691DRAFT_800667 [Macrolepiota fuliginosa MF-IS2]|uniref:Homeobox domain-containing protein n=1 Tax=Macrolepiota fuliginosa MF-IS2 TaxID=1400762 RepID=A0A9P5WXK8_9AGAR|nr:hypothetical protein P691DRAFT_800667 [Macrolepiota fuliginosa MF-IS2]
MAPQRQSYLKSLTPLLSGPVYLPSKPVTPCQRCMSIDVSDLKLQPPQPIDDFLRAHNIPEATVSAVSSIFMDKSSKLFNYTRTKLKRLLTSLPCLPGRCTGRSSLLKSSSIVRAWVGHYENELASWKENCLGMGLRLSRAKTSDERETERARFNQSSTPFLEAYFELNNYPCPADRQALARKTGNTPKQISDWFQNHRNRARKGGKQVQRTQIEPTFDEIMLVLEKQSPELSLTVDGSQATGSVPPENPPSPTETEIELDQHPYSILHVSNYVAAPHAFPVKYLPSHDHNLLSMYPSLEVQWDRRPTRQTKSRRSTKHDVDAFIDEFAHKCSIRGAASKRKRSDPTHIDGSPWTAATTMVIIPTSAPLPSLVRNVIPTQTITNATQPSQRQIRPLPRRATSKASSSLATIQYIPEIELEPSPEPPYGTRRKVRRLASDSDSSPTPLFPLTPAQNVVSLPRIEDVDLSSQLFSCFDIPHHPQPLTVLKTISRSFLDYASASIPFGTSFLSGITHVH